MAQRQFRDDDTSVWLERYGDGSGSPLTISSNTEQSVANAGLSGNHSLAVTTLNLDAVSTFANGDLVLIHQTRGSGAGAWELNKISSGGGTTTLTMAYATVNAYTDNGAANQSQIIKLPQYSAVTVNNGFTWSAPAWDGNKGGLLVWLCNGTTTVNGTISASAKGFRGAVGPASGSHTSGQQGEGTAADRGTVTTAANESAGGGANNNNNDRSGGGGGGHAASGTTGSTHGLSSPGIGGASTGAASLITAVFGGGGGSGASDSGAKGGDGGISGGGIFGFSSVSTLSSTGSVVSNGQAGENTSQGGAGGGGTGGFILLKTKTGTTHATSSITATKGNGGVSSFTGSGGNAADGRIHVDYGTWTASGTVSPAADTRSDTYVSGNSFNNTFTESVTIVDPTSTNVRIKTLSDTVTIAEVNTRSPQKVLAEAVTLSQNFQIGYFFSKQFTDTITIQSFLESYFGGVLIAWRKTAKQVADWDWNKIGKQ